MCRRTHETNGEEDEQTDAHDEEVILPSIAAQDVVVVRSPRNNSTPLFKTTILPEYIVINMGINIFI